MKKTLSLLSIFGSLLLADGTSTYGHSRVIVPKVTAKPIYHRGSSTKSTLNFKADHHSYNEKYRDFNYQKEGYYNRQGYYYGYYDHIGYFYDNIFYMYSLKYTYYDRKHRLKAFNVASRHQRVYRLHYSNSWNREHNYRKEGEMIYGHYDERSPQEKKIEPKEQRVERETPSATQEVVVPINVIVPMNFGQTTYYYHNHDHNYNHYEPYHQYSHQNNHRRVRVHRTTLQQKK